MNLSLPEDGDLKWGSKIRTAMKTLAEIGTPEFLEAKGLPIESVTATTTVIIKGTSGLTTTLVIDDKVVKSVVNVSNSSVKVTAEGVDDIHWLMCDETGQFLVCGDRMYRLDEVSTNKMALNVGVGIEIALPEGSHRTLLFQDGLKAIVDDDDTIRVVFDIDAVSSAYIRQLKRRLDNCQD